MSRQSGHRQCGHQQAGMTLVELTVAMAIGLFLIGGALYVYGQSRNSYRASDSLARLQESARFAMDTLEPDIRLARYWGLNAEPARITVTPGLTARCSGIAAPWALNDLSAAVEVLDDNWTLPCSAFNNAPRADSDVLIVRHAEPWQAGIQPVADGSRMQVQTTLARGQVFQSAVAPGLGAATSINNVTVNAYYVSNQSSFDAATPSLRRLTLGPGGDFDDEEVIPGVENLQVQLGMDTNGDGVVDRYVDGDQPLVDPASASFDPDAKVVAVRLWLLVGTPADDPGWQDDQHYSLALHDANLPDIVAGSADYPANNRRLQISRTIYLSNEGT
ncbi:MAG: PilW family protein [Gammaproteobacteria bacterium]